jgi:hypothetical protein
LSVVGGSVSNVDSVDVSNVVQGAVSVVVVVVVVVVNIVFSRRTIHEHLHFLNIYTQSIYTERIY